MVEVIIDIRLVIKSTIEIYEYGYAIKSYYYNDKFNPPSPHYLIEFSANLSKLRTALDSVNEYYSRVQPWNPLAQPLEQGKRTRRRPQGDSASGHAAPPSPRPADNDTRRTVVVTTAVDEMGRVMSKPENHARGEDVIMPEDGSSTAVRVPVATPQQVVVGAIPPAHHEDIPGVETSSLAMQTRECGVQLSMV